jgi:hypothetical protein
MAKQVKGEAQNDQDKGDEKQPESDGKLSFNGELRCVCWIFRRAV